MKRFVKISAYFLLFLNCVLYNSCKTQIVTGTSPEAENSKTDVLSLVNWNVQTFFDAETEGNEYSDFQSNARWCKDKYVSRLERLCDVITTLNADIYVFEEIENEGVLFDISNQLAGSSWDSKKLWNYGCFTKEKESCIGCAIISRIPIYDVKTHSMDIRIQNTTQPSVRPLLEARLSVNEKDVFLFVNHWKSKSGGEIASEIWRDWQEAVLGQEINKICKTYHNPNIFVCGDFNRDIKDFVCVFDRDEGNVFLRTFDGNLLVRSPWYSKNGNINSKIGTYYFQNEWEFIDNFFVAGNGDISGFTVKADEPWASKDQTPISYKIFTGEGYSDHLPIMCSLLIK